MGICSDLKQGQVLRTSEDNTHPPSNYHPFSSMATCLNGVNTCSNTWIWTSNCDKRTYYNSFKFPYFFCFDAVRSRHLILARRQLNSSNRTYAKAHMQECTRTGALAKHTYTEWLKPSPISYTPIVSSGEHTVRVCVSGVHAAFSSLCCQSLLGVCGLCVTHTANPAIVLESGEESRADRLPLL